MGLRDLSDQDDIDTEEREKQNENYATSNNTSSFGQGGQEFTFNDQITISQQANQPFARISGALFTGNIGFDLQTAQLDVGTNTINLLVDGSTNPLPRVSGHRIVSLSSGFTGTLTTMLGSQRPGETITLFNILGNTITIEHTAAATDNTFLTPDTNDFIFENNMTVVAIWDITTTKWRLQVAGIGGGGTSPPFTDTNPLIKGSVDATKLMRFEVDTLVPTTTTVALTVPAADTTLAGLSISQAFTGLNTFEGGIQIDDAASATHGLFQGIAATGVRLTLTAGEKFQLFDNITNILEINSAFGMDVKTLDIRNVDRLQLSGGTSLATSVNDVVWYLDSAGNLVSNVNATDGWIWSSGNISKMVLTDSTLEKRNVTAPTFQLYNTIAAQVGTAGTISFLANSSGVPTGISMASIIADTEVITGSGIGSMKLAVNLSGTPTSFVTLNDSNDGVVKILKTLNMNTNPILALGGETINSLTEDVSPVGSTDFVMTYDASAAGLKKVLLDNLPGGAGGANTALSNLTSPTNVNQDLLPDQTTGGNLGSTTANKEWFNVFSRRVTFPVATSIGAGDYSFGRVASPNRVQYNVPTGAVHRWTINSTNEMELSNVELILNGVNLSMENNSITDANQLQITGSTGDTIRGFLSGATGFFDISANENSGTIRMFAKTAGGVSNNMVDIDGGTGLVGFGQGGITFGISTNQPTITRSGNDLNYNVASAAQINLEVGATSIINITSSDINIAKDLDMTNNITVDWATTQSTVGAAGGASSLPATPSSYIIIKVNGTEFVIPAYAKA